jgi:putative alpha-1,2-mannosidase
MLAPFTGSGRRLWDGSAKAGERASAGRYAVDLTRYAVHAELAATRLAAFHLYRFPRTEAAKVMLDASSVIALLTPPNRQRPVRTRLCPAGRRGPNAGEPYYYLTAPIFTQTTIRLQHGRRFLIQAPGASESLPYIIGARLNGRRLDRAWLKHDELARGGRLELDLSDKPSAWGQTERPPSLTPSECEGALCAGPLSTSIRTSGHR